MKLKALGIVSATAVLVLGLSSANGGLFGPKGQDPEDKRIQVLEDRDEVLDRLYQQRPETKDKIAKAPGYATFNNKNINLFLLSSGHGYGVVVDNRTGKQTFMRMGSLGGGFGMGVKDFRAVFIFKRPEAMQQFIQSGWQFGGQGDIAAKQKQKALLLARPLSLILTWKSIKSPSGGLPFRRPFKGRNIGGTRS